MSNSERMGDGGPAFPVPDSNMTVPSEGMTLRDYFAAAAVMKLERVQRDLRDIEEERPRDIALKTRLEKLYEMIQEAVEVVRETGVDVQ